MYIGGKLLFADYIFNGYGNAKRDFLKQVDLHIFPQFAPIFYCFLSTYTWADTRADLGNTFSFLFNIGMKLEFECIAHLCKH